MQIAEKFTNNDQKFSLYFTDVCYDNFAVNSDGRVMIIDAENIIVVDKWQIEKGIVYCYYLILWFYAPPNSSVHPTCCHELDSNPK